MECPLRYKEGTTTTAGLTISYGGPLVAGAVQLLYSFTRGAGGFAIGRKFSFSPVVAADAPVFRIFEVNSEAIPSEDQLEDMFNTRLRLLTSLFQDGSASPIDIDQDGNTLLYVLLPVF